MIFFVSACGSSNNNTMPPMTGQPPGAGGGAPVQCNGGGGWPGTDGLVSACVQQQNPPAACQCMAQRFTQCYSWNSYQSLWQNPAVNQQANAMLAQCMQGAGGGQSGMPW